jgi:hypothetical protein
MDIGALLFSSVFLLIGLILLIFNKRVGLFLYNNQDKLLADFSFWNPRMHTLIVGTILTIGGIYGILEGIFKQK